MGTIPLIESFSDPRNLATIVTHTTILGLLITAILTPNRQTSIILIMVSIKLILYFFLKLRYNFKKTDYEIFCIEFGYDGTSIFTCLKSFLPSGICHC